MTDNKEQETPTGQALDAYGVTGNMGKVNISEDAAYRETVGSIDRAVTTSSTTTELDEAISAARGMINYYTAIKAQIYPECDMELVRKISALEALIRAAQRPEPERVTVYELMRLVDGSDAAHESTEMANFIRAYYPNGLIIVEDK